MTRITSHVVATLVAVVILVLSGAALLLNSAAVAPPQSTPTANTQASATTPIPPTLTLAPAPTQTGSIASPFPSPDFTAFAADCCADNGTPVIRTPSNAQVALWTAAAETQIARVQNATPMPTIQIGHFLPPSDEWVSYTHPTLNYGFAYPSNWFIESEPGSDTIYLHNVSPGMIKSTSDSNYIKIIITHQKSGLAGYTSLEDYLADPKYAASPEELLAPQQFETIENGYQIARQHRAAFMSNGGVLVIYLTDGKNLYALAAFDVKSRYLNVVDKVLTSWVMPGAAVKTPSPQAGDSPLVTTATNSEAVIMGEFLAPADDWVTYIDATYGYSFDYPANFLVVPASKTGYQTDIFNRSNDGFWYNPADPQNFHISIFAFEDKPTDINLESYVHSRRRFDPLAWNLVEENRVEFDKGYSGIEQILKSIKGRYKTRIFIEHDGKVYAIQSSASIYDDIFEKLLSTLKLPET